MSVRVAPKADVVTRCVPREDGSFLVTTRKAFGGSTHEIPVSAQVVVTEGKVERLAR